VHSGSKLCNWVGLPAALLVMLVPWSCMTLCARNAPAGRIPLLPLPSEAVPVLPSSLGTVSGWPLLSVHLFAGQGSSPSASEAPKGVNSSRCPACSPHALRVLRNGACCCPALALSLCL
jgi:hypothetical protein